jgi:branched-chain amino acid:cation transporter, LIVCS family
MKLSTFTISCSTGIAIFSMFFGSGNVVFPLLLGAHTGNQVMWALFGLTITAVGAPLLGLLSSVLFEGDCKEFFYRIGKIPGYLVVLLILALLGPVGVMPRCFTVAHAAVTTYFPDLTLFMFSLMCGAITLLLLWRREYVLPILGLWLSPILIITLLVIIGVGLYHAPALPVTDYTPMKATLEGLLVGYNTMDLLASIVFSVSIWILLKDELAMFGEEGAKKKLVPTYIWASVMGGGLLGVIYVGLSYIASAHSEVLQNGVPVRILADLAIHLLGNKLGLVANIAIFLACLTTIMSLAMAVVDVLHIEMMNTKLGQKVPYSYGAMMVGTILITVVFSNLGFDKIMAFLGPILETCYPAIIVLAVCNIFYKLYGFDWVKLPVYGTFLATVLWKSVGAFNLI